ncbi:MAG TPA: TetR/AcrR family transcriptional regulator, partial [Polyangiales bacterium]
MPRQSKDQRRREILDSTWKSIAKRGLTGTNMRALAAEAGYANGALAYYFAGKDELLEATFDHVQKQTMARVRRAARGLKGIAALRAFAAEMMPDDALKRLEARVVVPFWASAITQRSFAALHERALVTFRGEIRRCLREAVRLREIPPPTRTGQQREQAETLLAALMGIQVLAVLSPKQHDARMTRQVVEGFI